MNMFVKFGAATIRGTQMAAGVSHSSTHAFMDDFTTSNTGILGKLKAPCYQHRVLLLGLFLLSVGILNRLDNLISKKLYDEHYKLQLSLKGITLDRMMGRHH
eukprot:GHVU01152902.1.p2 GENE.GHVU01152902.1~~GHVU01152902.1.p2  ORF type:complete len:102 (+),score=2.42 GHVU01152902.1:724-1029(+)